MRSSNDVQVEFKDQFAFFQCPILRHNCKFVEIIVLYYTILQSPSTSLYHIAVTQYFILYHIAVTLYFIIPYCSHLVLYYTILQSPSHIAGILSVCCLSIYWRECLDILHKDLYYVLLVQIPCFTCSIYGLLFRSFVLHFKSILFVELAVTDNFENALNTIAINKFE